VDEAARHRGGRKGLVENAITDVGAGVERQRGRHPGLAEPVEQPVHGQARHQRERAALPDAPPAPSVQLHVERDDLEVDAFPAGREPEHDDRVGAVPADQAAQLARGVVEIDRQEMAPEFARELAARVDLMLSPRDEAGDEDVHEDTIGLERDPFNAGLTARR
jgi:hypothetical protein